MYLSSVPGNDSVKKHMPRNACLSQYDRICIVSSSGSIDFVFTVSGGKFVLFEVSDGEQQNDRV
jgi:hypothetical protein